jgi:hypothetical protein
MSDSDQKHAVRFNSQDDEIDPATSLQHVETLTGSHRPEELTEEAQEELKNLSITLQKSRLQAKRLENFSFEPVSLPPSRVRPFWHEDRSAVHYGRFLWE